MRRRNQITALVLAGIMSLSALLTGCGNDAEKTSESKATEAVSKETTEQKESSEQEPVDNTLVIALQTNALVTDYENNYLTNYLEEKLGIEIEFYFLPTAKDEVNTKLSLLASSGENLPDVLMVDGTLSNEAILQYGENGIFMPIGEYLSDASKMPNYNAIPKADRAAMDASNMMADGNQYGFINYSPSTWNLTPNRMFINRTWLDKLGLKVPTNTEELKDVLIAFRDKDPNGNGIKDEIPMTGYQSGGYGENILATIMNCFVFWNGGTQNGGLALDDKGEKVIAPFTTEEWKQGLLYLRDLYNEGLFSASVFTDDKSQWKATLNAETNIVGFLSMGSLGNFTQYGDVNSNSNYHDMEIMKPITGPDGICYSPYKEYVGVQQMFIFKGSEKVDLAIKLADEFYDNTTAIIMRYGEEEVNWTRNPEKLKGITNAYVYAGLYDAVTCATFGEGTWTTNTDKHWHAIGPRYFSLEASNTMGSLDTPYEPGSRTNLNAENLDWYVPMHPEYVLQQLTYTYEETQIMIDSNNTIPSYVNQTMAEFITGTRSIENGWDTYLKELEGMGLKTWLECAQAAHERMK